LSRASLYVCRRRSSRCSSRWSSGVTKCLAMIRAEVVAGGHARRPPWSDGDLPGPGHARPGDSTAHTAERHSVRVNGNFRDLEQHLVEHIREACLVVGCVAWLTNKRILEALARTPTSFTPTSRSGYRSRPFRSPRTGAPTGWNPSGGSVLDSPLDPPRALVNPLPTPNNPRFPGPGKCPPKAVILGFR
jgi:hypothetical protein